MTQKNEVQITSSKLERFQGPIPHPDIILKYGQVDPSFPQRIFVMAEKEQDHRHVIEEKIVVSEVANTKRAQNGLIILGVCAICASVPICIWGSPIAGGILGASGFLSPIAAALTVYREKKKKEDTEDED